MQKLKRSSLYPTIRGIKFTLWIALPFVLGFLVFGVAKVPWVILKRLYTLFGIWVVSYFFLFSEWIGFHQRKTLDLHMEPAFIDLTSRIQSDLNKHCARTVKITNVINEQLKIKFERAWTQHHQLGSSKLSILIAYHGTKASNIDPIVKKGLLLPGITSGVRVANGSAYGNGVYLSSDAGISMGYVRDEAKLLVCAILYHESLVSQFGSIYVVKDPTLVLPCYLVEYDGHPIARTYVSPSSQSLHIAVIYFLTFSLALVGYLLCATYLSDILVYILNKQSMLAIL